MHFTAISADFSFVLSEVKHLFIRIKMFIFLFFVNFIFFQWDKNYDQGIFVIAL